MNLNPQHLDSLRLLAPKHKGVFTLSDLSNLFLTKHPVALQQKLKPFLKAKILYRFCRGFYVTGDFSLEALSQKICPRSAISFGSVLAKEMLIGSIPQKTVYAVKVGKSRTYSSELGRVVHLGLLSELFFGYSQWREGICYADKEKAFLDLLYFYQKGRKFSFNIYSDIQTNRLDRNILKKYIGRYKNQKFKKFVEGLLNGKHKVG